MRLDEAAIIIATTCHAGQLDLTDNPVIDHPLAVMNLTVGEMERALAVLHDVPEDCGITANRVVS